LNASKVSFVSSRKYDLATFPSESQSQPSHHIAIFILLYFVIVSNIDAIHAALEYAKDVYVAGDTNTMYELPLVIQNNKDSVIEEIKNI